MREGNENAQTFYFENAIVRVHFSELTEEKRKIRTKTLHKATEDLLKAREKGAREWQRAFKSH